MEWHTRTGSPHCLTDLESAAAGQASTIILLRPEDDKVTRSVSKFSIISSVKNQSTLFLIKKLKIRSQCQDNSLIFQIPNAFLGLDPTVEAIDCSSHTRAV